MQNEIERHKNMIEASGLGLLPGVALAFLVSLIVMTALFFETWWATIVVLLTLVAGRGAVQRRGRRQSSPG